MVLGVTGLPPLFGNAGKEEMLISWQPPNPGWISINTDACLLYYRLWFYRSCIRDYEGHHIMSFSRNLGISSVLNAEVWSVFRGSESRLGSWFRTYHYSNDNADAISFFVGLPTDAKAMVADFMSKRWKFGRKPFDLTAPPGLNVSSKDLLGFGSSLFDHGENGICISTLKDRDQCRVPKGDFHGSNEAFAFG
ncbi:hypothetical protein F3Y22_tig00116962pilonHSYRG00616 [Hibiscus syriacus]|uniref:Uncharacterized protein n=1 Tax=Hibiscus syriacus TaxID=106335 RepID=A0A6A2WW91_HIBSY|nr:hypothetical protein F3Y22_tig00116962pilonHSYRG00616 [Hibiscus syriacus]